MKEVTIYHNPRCTSSRKALEILIAHAIEPTVIEYLKTPLSKAEIIELLNLLRITPRALLRQREEIYQKLNLADPALTEAQLIACLVDNPVLIERPIVVINKQAIIARPPERLLEIL